MFNIMKISKVWFSVFIVTCIIVVLCVLVQRHRKSVLDLDIDYFLAENFHCCTQGAVTYSSEDCEFFTLLTCGMDMMHNNQQVEAWESWSYCLANLSSSRYKAITYLGIGSVLGEVDAETSLLLLKKALQLSQDLKPSNKQLEYCCLNELVRILVRQAEYGSTDQKIDHLVKQYCQMADAILSNHKFKVKESSVSHSVYRTSIESLLWLGDDKLVKSYMSKLKSNRFWYVDRKLITPYINVLYGVESYIKRDLDLSVKIFMAAIDDIGQKDSYLHPDLELPYAYLANIFYEEQKYNMAIDYMEHSVRSLLSSNYDSQDEVFKFIPFKEMKNWENAYNVILCFMKIQEFQVARFIDEPSVVRLESIRHISCYTNQLIKDWFFNAANPNTLIYATKLLKENNALTLSVLYEDSKTAYVDEMFLLGAEPSAFYLSYLMEMKLSSNAAYLDQPYLQSINSLTVDFLSDGIRDNHDIEDEDIARSLQLLQEKLEVFESKEHSLDGLLVDNVIPEISGNTAVLKYFCHRQYIYATCYTRDTKVVERIVSQSIDSSVSQLLRSLKGGAAKSKAQYLIYDKLISPFEHCLQGVESLTILLDGDLNKVPFGVLLDKDDRFLISKYAINYTYSSRSVEKEVSTRVAPILAVAPVFAEQDSHVNDMRSATSDVNNGVYSPEQLSTLSESLYEIDSIVEMYQKVNYDYTVLTSTSATKANFLGEAKDNAIIHIATHGVGSDNREAGLFFSDLDEETNSFLSLSELYTIDINADLVVLSACQTAVGEIKSGEGVMSLPRGFIYAGASNVIASLWKVDDVATRYLMVQFYKHLIQDGCSYSVALQKSKIDCINEGFLPLDWAAFVVVKD